MNGSAAKVSPSLPAAAPSSDSRRYPPVDGTHGALVLRPDGLVERGVQRVDVLPLPRRRPLQLVGQRLQHHPAVPQRRLNFLHRLQRVRWDNVDGNDISVILKFDTVTGS